jgi:hypothetical protein
MIADVSLAAPGAELARTPIEIAAQQTDVLFDTASGALLGDLPRGTDFHKFLWELKLPAEDVARYAEDAIIRFVDMRGVTVSCECVALMGTDHDILLLDVSFREGDRELKKSYKIE